MKQYLADSARTAAGDPMHIELVSDYEFVHTATKICLAIQDLDRMKKALFYGKKPPAELTPMEEGDNFDPITSQNIVHAIIGIVTEAGELLELLLDKDKLSDEKLVDEAGDGLWYNAMLFRELGTTFEEVSSKNLAKLKVRYPDKFEAARAITRNDAAENKVFA